MATNVYLPQWGMGMNDATIIKWLTKEGDLVKKGDQLVEVESSKVNAEIESPESGKIGKILYEEGQVAKVGEILAIIIGENETLPEENNSEASKEDNSEIKLPSTSKKIKETVQITPRARKLAKELNIDISLVKGTGPNGRILDDDIKSFNSDNSKSSEISENISGIRKVIATRMTQSNEIPSVTLVSKVVLDKFNEYQKILISEWRKDKIRPTSQDLLIKCLSNAIKKYPVFNSHYLNNEIKTFDDINIGYAFAAKQGLVVPVIKNTEKKSIIEIAKTIREYSKIEKTGFKPEHFSDGTFSITNLSSTVVDYFDPLINPPQVGIIGIGRTLNEPSIDQGELKDRKVAHISLTFDHRVVDGFPAAKFLEEIIKNINEPSIIDG
ncbi:MAG: dihydrolipoamide acetyltransferase family protein [Dehalococcoidia bacterium]